MRTSCSKAQKKQCKSVFRVGFCSTLCLVCCHTIDSLFRVYDHTKKMQNAVTYKNRTQASKTTLTELCRHCFAVIL